MAFFLETLLGGLMAGVLYSVVALGFVLRGNSTQAFICMPIQLLCGCQAGTDKSAIPSKMLALIDCPIPTPCPCPSTTSNS